MSIWHAPTGRLVRGHVLDVNERAFLRSLQFYDKQLYVMWNPKKLKGWGCWEIRRLPNQKTAVYQGTHQGMSFFKLTYVDRRDIHHVLDCAFLNYDVLRKLKEIDTFRIVKESGYASLDDLLTARAAEHKEKTQARAAENLRYAIKQNKSAMSAFHEMVRSGIHPAEVLKSTKWVHHS